MNITDVVLIALGSWFMIRGVLKGLSGQLLSLASIVGGFFLSMRFHGDLASLLSDNFDLSPVVAKGISIAAIFIAIALICAIVGRLIKRALSSVELGWLDKTVGAAFGLIKIYLITLAVMFVGMLTSPIVGSGWYEDSRVVTAVSKTVPYVSPILDKLGLLPDLSAIQTSFSDLIREQAQKSIFGAQSDDS